MPIVFDLPVPPSVNRTRRVNWAAHKEYKAWMKAADSLVMLAKSKARDSFRQILGQYEITIILNEHLSKADADNPAKACIDFCRRIALVKDDSPRYLRKITIEFGEAPEGCRIILRPICG